MIPTCSSKSFLFRPLRGIAARCLLAAIPLAIAPAAHAAYNLTFVPDPTGTGLINLLGINNSGTIAGFDNGVTNQGFTLILPSSFTGVNFPVGVSSMPPASMPRAMYRAFSWTRRAIRMVSQKLAGSSKPLITP